MHPLQVNASPRSRVSNCLPQTIFFLATCRAFYFKYIPVSTGMSILALCWQSIDTEAANQSEWKRKSLVHFVRTQNEHSTTICWAFRLKKWNAVHHHLASENLCKATRPAHNGAQHFKPEEEQLEKHTKKYTSTESAQGKTETPQP